MSKEQKERLIYAIIGLVLNYFAFAYLYADFNPFNQSKEVRGLQLLIFFTSQTLIQLALNVKYI